MSVQELLIKYRFKDYPYIVADGKGNFYQLPHCANKYYKKFRELNLVLNNKVTLGYRINRKFISLKQLRLQAYICSEVITVSLAVKDSDIPF